MTDVIFPAEWEPHKRSWMCWPCRTEAWGDAAAMTRAKAATAAVAQAIAGFEPVVVAARPEDAGEAAATGLPVLACPLDDSWARDITPTFVRKGAGRAAMSWRFNAWGGKYAPFDRDAAFAAQVADYAGLPLSRAPLVCEGGAIHSDGQGTLLTTAQCLLNPNRNPELSRADIERILRDVAGARRIMWLEDGFSDEETDGHIDNIACFAAPGRVILGIPDSKSHPDAGAVTAARARLKAEGMTVIELPQPKTIRHDACGRLLQTSYVNFYLCNDGLVMPVFDDPHDDAARAVLAGCFPGRDIVTVRALDIVVGGGGIHCITAQEPK